MTDRDIASAVLRDVGGAANVVANSLCMTRLRITVANPMAINRAAIDQIDGVLGTATRGSNGIEVVFGPKAVRGVFLEFSRLTGVSEETDPQAGVRAHRGKLHVHISPSARRANAEKDARERPAGISVLADKLDLSRLLDDKEEDVESLLDDDEGALRLLVINGPNINMLGIREPGVYGKEDFSSLLALCKETAIKVGFSDCRCYQSNHEGDLVDEIQDALGVFDGIVINPGAYTHTSIALLDALKAVSIPAIEVHISKVENRESFRQTSYLRTACIETITGMGIDGYRVAIEHMAEHLGLS